MSTIIQIKRSTSGLAPNTDALVNSELAYSQDATNNGANAILYIESIDNASNPVIHKIGGKYYTDIIDSANTEPSANSLVKRYANGSIAANVVYASELVGNITGTVTGVAASANKLETPRNITLSGDLEGNVLFDGTTDVTIVANVINNSVALGTDTTGDYVANITAGTGIEVSGFSGETQNLTVTLANTTVTAGSYGGATNVPIIVVDSQGRITTAANASISTTLNLSANTGSNTLSLINDTLKFTANGVGISTEVSLGNVLITNTGVTNVFSSSEITASQNTGNINFSLATTGVAAGSYGGTTNIPIIVVDSKGRITTAANASISTSFTLNGDTGTDTFNSGDTLRFVGVAPGISTAVSDNTVSITNTGVTGITGTANEVNVSAASGNITIGLPDDVTISRNLSVAGNLTVSGNIVTLGVENLLVNDSLIHLANNNTSTDVLDIGFDGSYYDSTSSTQRFAGLFRDASDSGKFKLFSNVATDPSISATIDTNVANGYTVATLNAKIDGPSANVLNANVSTLLEANALQLTNALAVIYGGTGRATLTANAVIAGDGTNQVRLVTGTTGQVLQVDAAGQLVFAGIDGGTF